MIQFTEKDGAIIFAVRVVPRASRSEIVGELGGALKIKIAAPPVEGAANTELIKVLSKRLSVPKIAVEILSGHASRQKQVRISGINYADLLNLIERPVNNSAQQRITEPQQTQGDQNERG